MFTIRLWFSGSALRNGLYYLAFGGTVRKPGRALVKRESVEGTRAQGRENI